MYFLSRSIPRVEAYFLLRVCLDFLPQDVEHERRHEHWPHPVREPPVPLARVVVEILPHDLELERRHLLPDLSARDLPAVLPPDVVLRRNGVAPEDLAVLGGADAPNGLRPRGRRTAEG